MLDNITYWRDTTLGGVEACQVHNSRHSFPNHVHDTVYAVGLMEKGGSYSLGLGRDEGFVGPGDIALINPGQVHSGVPAPDVAVTYRMLYLDIDMIHTAATDLDAGFGSLPEFGNVVVKDPVLRHKLNQVCLCMASPAEALEKESLLFDAVAMLLSRYANVRTAKSHSHHHPRAIREAKAFLRNNLDQKLTLEQLAVTVGVSRYHLLRLFKQHTGLSPHLYRTQCRIDLAKTLLRQAVPFAQVALETGFTDQSHFTNRFKQFTAATPSQYR